MQRTWIAAVLMHISNNPSCFKRCKLQFFAWEGEINFLIMVWWRYHPAALQLCNRAESRHNYFALSSRRKARCWSVLFSHLMQDYEKYCRFIVNKYFQFSLSHSCAKSQRKFPQPQFLIQCSCRQPLQWIKTQCSASLSTTITSMSQDWNNIQMCSSCHMRIKTNHYRYNE